LLQIIGRTDRGRRRARNEDHFAVDAGRGLAVLADGMGGLRDGHLASREAVAGIVEALREAQDAGAGPLPPAALEAALAAANVRLRHYAAARGAAGAMGTTGLALCLQADGRGALAHVGDSRGYRWHDGGLQRLTRDHSLAQELLEQGLADADAARGSRYRNVITRALGLEPELRPESRELRLVAGDLLLLCSDGLWDMVAEAELARLLGECGAGEVELARCADALVAAANAAGGHDNITVVLARL
jgi:protein phosphatase